MCAVINSDVAKDDAVSRPPMSFDASPDMGEDNSQALPDNLFWYAEYHDAAGEDDGARIVMARVFAVQVPLTLPANLKRSISAFDKRNDDLKMLWQNKRWQHTRFYQRIFCVPETIKTENDARKHFVNVVFCRDVAAFYDDIGYHMKRKTLAYWQVQNGASTFKVERRDTCVTVSGIGSLMLRWRSMMGADHVKACEWAQAGRTSPEVVQAAYGDYVTFTCETQAAAVGLAGSICGYLQERGYINLVSTRIK